MACFYPHVAWRSSDINPDTGKRPLVFGLGQSTGGSRVMVPCGQCIGCQRGRARQWAIRIMHELRGAGNSTNAFVTLTYSPANLPAGATLVKSDLQNFMKRLRKTRPAGLRFFACGEYGETYQRPHYHVLLLNTGFPDMRPWKKSASGHQIYISPELQALWPDGDSYVGHVSAASAGYVAGYVVKAVGRYRQDGRLPEFQVMSRRPGLGSAYFDAHGEEMFRHDNVVADVGARRIYLPVPKYYDNKLVDKSRLEEVKAARRRMVLSPAVRADNTGERRRVRAQIEYEKTHRFKRDPT